MREGVSTRPGVPFSGACGGVTNGFITGDRGRERTGPGIQVDDIANKGVVKRVKGGVDIERRAHWRWWVDLYASRTSGAFLKCSSGSHVDSARE